MDTLAPYLWYELWYGLSMAFFTLGFSLRYDGRRNIPRSGPVLLLANHQSFFDPLCIGVASPRHLWYLARKTLFHNPLFGDLLRTYPIVPVDHLGIAKEGLRRILEQLEANHPVLIFPEGERSRTGLVQPLKPGVLLLINRCEAPIVPVGIAGAYQALSRHMRIPRPSPLFWPQTGSDIVVSIGRPVPADGFRKMPRSQALEELHGLILKQYRRAESLRRQS